MIRRRALAAIVAAAACTPIKPVPITNAPLNACPCEGFIVEGGATPRCRDGRCEIQTPGNRPDYPFFVVVDVPTSSSYAPGATFVFYSNQVGDPAFGASAPSTSGPVPRCVRPRCLRLGTMTRARGSYRVSADVSYGLPEDTAIPVRVQYTPIGGPQFPTSKVENLTPAQAARTAALVANLPVAPIFAFPRTVGEADATEVNFVQPFPSGTYLRVLFPEAPFDEFFPPRADIQSASTLATIDDDFTLTAETLDPPRTLDIEREAGLDGWQVWLRDSVSGRRISTLRTLSGAATSVRLDTTNETRTARDDTLEAVLAPPPSSIGLPQYISTAFSGSFGTLAFPPLPRAAQVVGNVAEPTVEPTGALLGYAARVSFESSEITTLDGQANTLLHYSTALNTDERGRFATVLPPGTYSVTVEPAEGTGFASYRQSVIVDKYPTAVTLQPPRRTLVSGRVMLVDGRPLAEAEILASARTPETPFTPKPRPGRATTNPQGGFDIELDPGPYVITVIPKRGTGFPRVVTRTTIPTVRAELPDIRVPPPSPLAFQLRDPIPGIEQVVPNALVRVFAVPGVTQGAALEDETADPEPVEIGTALSNADGEVEILLAPAPR